MAEAALETPSTPTPAATPAAPEFGEAFAAIDALGRDEGTPEPPPQPPPGDGRTRGPDGKFAKAGDKPPEKPAAAPEPPKADDDIDPSKLKTSELAKHYHALKAKEKAWLKEREELNKKISTPQEWPEKKTYEEKLAEREKRIEEHNKRIGEYEMELQFSNFTRSQAYKDQYEKPLQQAYAAGQAKTAMLQIVERRDEENNVLQAARDATAADFDTIMRIRDERTAIKKAVEMFGDGASVVLQHRENVFQKNALIDEAVKEYQTKGVEREKTIRDAQEKRIKEVTGLIDNFRKAAIEKYPQLFKPDDSDPKGNELLEKGNHLLERVMRNGAPIKDGEKQMTDEELAIAVSAVRNKAAAFDRVNYRRHMLEKRIKELEKDLAAYKASTPGNGDGSGRTPPAGDDDPLQKIYKLGKEM